MSYTIKPCEYEWWCHRCNASGCATSVSAAEETASEHEMAAHSEVES